MPVNTAALKTFAPAMRRQLLEAVGRKLDLLLNSQTPDTLSTYARQIAELREQEAENRDQLLERVAYTWFNRLCALRYLDARGWHPFGCKVLMPAGEGETQPELLKLMRAGSLPTELKAHTNASRLHGLLDGQIQTAIAGADPQGEVYRELVLTTSRFYHELLPNIFEGLDDSSELLLPDDFLSEGSIAGGFRREISDEDCQDVEIIGWLYQFYIAEKKDEVMARKKAVPSEDIPAVTQLFTPHWIVRYLVENSLGRLWLLNRPGSKLREQMPYYIEGEAETGFLKINKPEEIKVLDPACGSGHMLTYAFDLLTLIYEEEGYAPSEVPGLILQHNLHGLEICPRAAQLTELALVFKAREKSRRFFQPEQLVGPQVLELKDVQFEGDELNDYIAALGLGGLFNQNLFKLLLQFEKAKNFGSLIQPCIEVRAIAEVRRAIEAKDPSGQPFLRHTHLKALCVLEQAEALAQQHHVVVANPPYMGVGAFNTHLKVFAANNYPLSKADLFAMFIENVSRRAIKNGYSAMITMHSWMFIASFEKMRATLLQDSTVLSMAHLGSRGFDTISGEVVQTTAFVCQKRCNPFFQAIYLRLVAGRNEAEKHAQFLSGSHRFRSSIERLKCIPRIPLAYWISDSLVRAFQTSTALGEQLEIKSGMSTTDNNRFLKLWPEVGHARIGFNYKSAADAAHSNRRWFPINKGGSCRRWYGNNEYIINWQNDGSDIKAAVVNNPSDPDSTHWSRRIYNTEYFFQPSLTWSKVATGDFSLRYAGEGFLFSDASNGIFCKQRPLKPFLCFLNSAVARSYLDLLAPTMNFYPNDVARVPAIALLTTSNSGSLTAIANECITLARDDWDNFETSWDFRDQPLLRAVLKGTTLKASWRNWQAQSTAAIRQMQELETENNRLFINAYGLDGELQPEVPEEQITLARSDQRKDLAAFLSYATGCMMGRYSLDHPGLILADSRDSQAEQLAAYEEKVGKPLAEVQFKPDTDAVIPVLDGEWFEDDIVARTREFLEVTFPESTVTENLRFIEESLGKDIRKYFCTEFYKDHLQTYKKRPIYWMVQSPAGPSRGGFACLIYLHRYTKDTLNQVLNNYLRPYLQKLEARLAQLGLDQLNDSLPTRERTAARKEAEKITKVLKECQAWEQDALLPLAQQRIELDLDDGVKVNYLKLQDVLAKIPGLAAKED
ncbi:MAG: hypothetical protein RLZZ216_1026 [Cyanobacteriota bacterium]|jgi:hypothetical protein